jgi:uncharacterized protein YdgA (DUF945 family)
MTDEGVRLVSDGTKDGTLVLLDGKPLLGVTEVVWRMNRRERTAQITIELKDVRVDLSHAIEDASRTSLNATQTMVVTEE